MKASQKPQFGLSTAYTQAKTHASMLAERDVHTSSLRRISLTLLTFETGWSRLCKENTNESSAISQDWRA